METTKNNEKTHARMAFFSGLNNCKYGRQRERYSTMFASSDRKRIKVYDDEDK